MKEDHDNILHSIPTTEELEDEIATLVAEIIYNRAYEEVQNYIQSEKFKEMVDVMKRRERERVMLDVINQIQAEKEELIRVEQEKLTTQIIQQKSVEEIIFENKKKIEELKRKEYLEKQKEDADRLLEVQRRRQLEEEEEKKLLEERNKQKQLQDAILQRNQKLSFGLKKKSF